MTRGDMRGARALRSPHPTLPPNRPCPLFNSISHNAHRRHKETFASLSLLFHSLGSVGCAPPVFCLTLSRCGRAPQTPPAPRRSTRAGLRLHSWPGTPTRRTKGAPSLLQAPLVSLSSVFFRACITTFSNQSTLHCIWALLRTLRDLHSASHPCFATLCRDRALSFCPMKWRLFLAM